MMSHYGLPLEYDDPWISGTLELSIETLTGTAFEIRVSPNDTIMSIKTKIQRVEGIPVAQQHLLYNLEELDNSASLRDYPIQNGSTLKLVLSMRGGPISTRRLPPVDEMAWKELQELMSETNRDDLFEKLPTGSKVTVLVFRDGDQVNLFRVIENEDGTYSPLSESWSGSSIRKLFAEEDPEDSARRLEENSVTMGKMQELREKLECLSIQKKEKKQAEAIDGSVGSQLESNTVATVLQETASSSSVPNDEKYFCLPVVHDVYSRTLKLTNNTPCAISQSVNEGSFPSVSKTTVLGPCVRTNRPGINKARKEAQNILRMQTKALSVLVDSDVNPSLGAMKKAPLPDICRSSKNDYRLDNVNDKVSNSDEVSKKLREKTASRVPTSSFAILEEENDDGAAANICPSQSSVMGMQTNEEVAVAYSPVPRDRVSTTLSRSRYRVSRYLLENDERPKTTPSKINQRQQTARQLCDILTETERQGRERTRHILSTFSNLDLLHDLPGKSSSKSKIGTSSVNGSKVSSYSGEGEKDDINSKQDPLLHMERIRLHLRKRASLNSLRPSHREEVILPLPAPPPLQKLPPPIVKKKLRCLQCNKRLNITNTHTCRCGSIFCSLHRYSEVHNCPFDYKQEGKKLLQQANPLVAASKLPKI